MSNLTYQFSVSDAEKWKSADIATIIYNLRFWLLKNKANQHNIHDGRVWTYNTIKAWANLFPWLSEPQIKRLLKKLEDAGYLIKGNYNKDKFTKTVWYSLDEPEFKVNQPETPVVVDSTKSYYRENDIVPSEVRSRTLSTDNKQTDSKSVNNARVISNFADQVMTELLTDNLPANQQRYARMKITEYQERFSGSQSVADCWSYVVTAVNHQISLTGS